MVAEGDGKGTEPVTAAVPALGPGVTQEELLGLAAVKAVVPATNRITVDALAERLPVKWPGEGQPGPNSGLVWSATWDRDVAARIIDEVASGRTVKKVCEEGWAVRVQTFRRWCLMVPELAELYREARVLQASAVFDEALDVARDNAATPKNETTNAAVRILLDTLKWAAARLDPRVYGDKFTPAGAITVRITTNLDLDDAAVAANQAPLDMEEVEGIYTVKAAMPLATAVSPDQPVEALSGAGSEAMRSVVSPPPKRKAGRPVGSKSGPRKKRPYATEAGEAWRNVEKGRELLAAAREEADREQGPGEEEEAAV